MVHGLHVGRDQSCVRRRLADGQNILGSHEDRTQIHPMGVSGIEDDDVGAVVGDRRGNQIIPDGVSDDIDRLVTRLAQHDPAHGVQDRNGLQHPVPTMVSARPGQAHALEQGVRAQYADV
ncbi:hypothetical protein D3C71_866570 [compost metagenome]